MGYRAYPEYRDSGVEWLGRVPADWKLRRLKFSSYLINEKVDAQESTSGYLGLEHIESWTAKRITDDTSTSEGNASKFFPGDILFGKLRPYLAKVWQADSYGIATTEALVIRPDNGVAGSFLKYYMLSRDFIDVVNGSTYGSKMPRASWDFIGNLSLLIPNIEEQRQIARFLDHKTAKIDRLIGKKKELIEKFQEQRIATITQLVTKGLTSDVAIKASNNQWFDSLPNHWQVIRLKDLVVDAIAGPYGSSLTKSMYTNSGYRVYGQQQVIPEDFSIGDYYISEEKYEEMQRYRTLPGDLLISVMGTIGRAALVPEDAEHGIINPRLVLYRANKKIVRPEYLKNFINSQPSQNYFSLVAQGTTMEGINMALIGELAVAVPPVNEQDGILLAQKTRTARLDKQVESVTNAIERLQEYRIALITAAVTGQIDVRAQGIDNGS